MSTYQVIQGDCLKSLKLLPSESVDCCVTSPPYYGLRDYGVDGQIGGEETPEAFVQRLVEVFREVRRVLKNDGTCWVNIGDSYSRGDRGTVPPQRGDAASKSDDKKYNFVSASAKMGKHPEIKPKDLIATPWMLALALRADGWFLRQDIIWHKPNPMPEKVADRCTKAHEYIFLLSKSSTYYFDHEAFKEPSKDPAITEKRNRRSVWTVNTKSYKEAHFATYPPELIEPCILAGSRKGGTVLDPFGGSGTTAEVAIKHGRNAILCELNPEYIGIISRRLSSVETLLDI